VRRSNKGNKRKGADNKKMPTLLSVASSERIQNKKSCKLEDLKDISTAKQLLDNVGIREDDIPRNIDRLLKLLGIIALGKDFSKSEEYFFKKFGKQCSMFGSVTIDDNNYIGMFYRTPCSVNLINFIVAYELAHCCLNSAKLESEDGHILINCDGKADYFCNDEEIKNADEFASELLMPTDWLKKEYKSQKNPVELAKKYKVSESVMISRLKKLGFGG